MREVSELGAHQTARGADGSPLITGGPAFAKRVGSFAALLREQEPASGGQWVVDRGLWVVG